MKYLLAAVLCLAFPMLASAQPTFNPTTVVFTASPDHNATFADGTKVVTGYRLKHYLSGATSPIMTVDLCKPTPNATSVITVVNTSAPCTTGGLLFATPLLVNTTYVAKVTAYGPGGESLPSAASNFFVLGGSPSPVPGTPAVQ